MSVLSSMVSNHSFHRSEPALGFFLPAYNKRVRSVSPLPASSYVKKRSYSDTNEPVSQQEPVKRSRTAPSSPPSTQSHSSFDRSPIVPLSLHKSAKRSSIKLPSINDALASIPARPVAPTVSLDYFDTYKPNDENWRFGLLDSIRNSKGSASLDPSLRTTLPSIHEFDKTAKRPRFDSRVGLKSFPTFPQQRKINFPYESNYTYLNSTYMTDVKKFPEYLELAQSLVQLSRPEHPEESKSLERSLEKTFEYPQRLGKFPLTPQYGYKYAHQSPEIAPSAPKSPKNAHKFIPITPPSVKDKSRSELMKSPPKHAPATPRMCISCGSDQSPCWRPSWSIREGQLCNSCGLRYKKTAARCLNDECKKIPAKGEWSLMQSKGLVTFADGTRAHECLDCAGKVEVRR